MKAFSIPCYSIAGFFLYTLELMAFVQVPEAGMKLGLMGVFSIPAIVFLMLGMALNGFERWQKHTGTVLIVSGLVGVFLCITMACIMNTKEFSIFMDPQLPANLSDYTNGFGAIALALSAGAWLVYWGNRVNSQPQGNCERSSGLPF